MHKRQPLFDAAGLPGCRNPAVICDGYGQWSIISLLYFNDEWRGID
jgi:hypothetical protein